MTKAIATAMEAGALGPGRKAPSVKLEWAKDGPLHIELWGDAERIFKVAGHDAVAHGLISQIALLGAPGTRADDGASNFALGFVDSMKPKDAAEALLMTQMAAIHQATMMLARKLNHVDTIPQQDAAERAVNKLARTYAGQMEALKRYRSKGQQVVRVERVTVENGGQAIVGSVPRGGEGPL